MFVSNLGAPPEILGPSQYALEVQPLEDESGFMVAFPVAEDPETNRVVFVETLLCPAVIDEFDFYEVSFQISVISLDDSSEPVTTQMRDQARQYLPADCVPHLLCIVGLSCELLIEAVQPMLIYYVTKERSLPLKALEKYDLLTWYIQHMGYTLYERGVDAIGRDLWKLSRPLIPATRDTS